MHWRQNRQDSLWKRLAVRIPQVLRNLDVDRRLHLVAYMESALPEGFSGSGAAPGGSDHGHMVCSYQLPTRAVGRGLQPFQRCGHCPFALLAKMAEHAYGDSRRKWSEVELPAPTLAVSESLAALPAV